MTFIGCKGGSLRNIDWKAVTKCLHKIFINLFCGLRVIMIFVSYF